VFAIGRRRGRPKHRAVNGLRAQVDFTDARSLARRRSEKSVL
jgi:hypothetical protein